MDGNSCSTELGDTDLFATLIGSLFDDMDLFLFVELTTDYVRNSLVPACLSVFSTSLTA